jgi:hypothetical protein
VEDEVALDTLRRFLCDPAGQFLAQSLGLRLADEVEEVDDLEPLVLSSRGPEKRSVQAAVVRATLSGDTEPLYPRLRARGLLPSGPLGERQFEVEQLKTRPYASALLGWMQGEPLESRRYEVDIDGVRLHGRVADRHPEGLVRLRAGTLNGNAVIRQGLDWLLANAAGDALPLVQFHDGGDAGPGPHVLPALSVPAARAALRALLQLRQRGLREPLRFAPYTGWVLYNAPAEKQRSEGWKQWHGSDRSWGESSSDAWQLLLRGADPFATDASRPAAQQPGGLQRGARRPPSAPKHARRAAHEHRHRREDPAHGRDPYLALPLEGIRLIEASAGTGKTFTLATLFTRLVVEQGLRIGQILAVTFTDAATQELRKRIRERLALAARLVDLEPAEVKHRTCD